MIQATMSNPIHQYNPTSIFDLKLQPNSSELKLLVKNRYCDLDLSSGVAYFYLELTDGTNSFILAVRYYEWLAATNADYVFCKYTKLLRGKASLNTLEVSRIPKTSLAIAKKGEQINPLANSNFTLQRDYVYLHKENVEVTKVLDKQSDLLYRCTGTATLNNGKYVSAIVKINDLLSTSKCGIQYRYLNINEKIITDLEVFNYEI